MPTPKRAISLRVAKQNPRPRKYATAAERQKALRERFPTLCVRVEQEQADFMKRIADEQGRTLQDVHLAFIKYANGRGNQWLTQGLKGFAPLPRFEETPKENPMKRKPTPAQIAARERFAEMARSGAFKKKARKKNPMVISKQADESLSRQGSRGYVRKLLDRYSDEGHVVSVKKTRSGSIGIAFDGGRMLTVANARKKLEDHYGITERMGRRANPGVRDSRTEVHLGGRYYGLIGKGSELGHYTYIVYRDPRDFEGDKVVPDFNGRYYQSMNAALRALERYKKKMILENPRASNPIILVSDKPIASKRKANPVKPKRQRMLNISWTTAGGQRDMMSVPIDFVFTHYVGNVAERFFARTENGQLIVSEYSTGGRIGQVPYTMRAAALNDRDAAKRYVGEMLSRIGAERFKAAVKKFDPIN